MGAVPSREFHESPVALVFTRSGTTLQMARLPLTPHFFPSADCLAFRQLCDCRGSQSMKYGFALNEGPSHERHWRAGGMRRGGVCNLQASDAWDELCEEELEPDPSAPYQRDMMEFLLPTDEAANFFVSREGRNAKENFAMTGNACRDGESQVTTEDLYRLLVTEGTVPALTDTNAEMQELYRTELAWRKARAVICHYRQSQCEGNEEEEAKVRLAEQVPPPRRFLRALPTAVVAVVDSDEAMRKAPRKCAIPCDGILHLMENDGMLFLASRRSDGYIVPPTPIRVVGCNSLLPAMCRGTSWLRGYDATPVAEGEEDAYIESLPLSRRPPVLCACHFCEAAVSEKAFGRGLLEGLGYYALHSRMAGMEDLVARPVWHLGLASHASLLHFVAEIRQLVSMATFPAGVRVSVRGSRLLLRMQERALRAVCQLLCPCTDSFAPQPWGQHVWKQNVINAALYDYGGRIGVHPTTGELCVPQRIHDVVLHQTEKEADDTRDGSMQLVFIVVNPWQNATSPSALMRRKDTPEEEDEASAEVFYDGDLLVHDHVRHRWRRLLQPDVSLETVLLCWVKKLLAAATFRHSDKGWLRDVEGRIVQEGRFHIWCTMHDGLPYFFGVIPKFAKERRRRMLRQARGKFLRDEESQHRPEVKGEEQDDVTPAQDHQARRRCAHPLPAHSKRHGDAANYFRNGCFTWNPYGSCR
ncbi:uncharacterized protein Tco025E_00320 [Trypanosoma conorhini]|uniref:Uncharacterized protein n=1 Tax=Trypanosoma conorhini TaxID=83891 RepID=A0A3R7LHN4_9TRYP|nr:uncharacterized protein Tco025E_00320 [Trypanosoma conorhini]RNF27458.1 hypothetical protein Tco025E_00320 [Trypanosoma conorhini]